MRLWLAMLAFFLTLNHTLSAQEVAQPGDEPPAKEVTIDELKEGVNDATLLVKFITQEFAKIREKAEDDPADADKMIEKLAALLDTLDPQSLRAKAMLGQGKAAISNVKQSLLVQRTPIEKLEKALRDDPNVAANISNYVLKARTDAYSVVYEKPEESERKRDEAVALLDSVKNHISNKQAEAALKQGLAILASLDRSIASGKKIVELIGKEATTLPVGSTWLNGSALSDEDLRGKVVLLDFWAMWCGPCIATFPHLREWDKKYADKGLVIVGVTRNDNTTWDSEEKRAIRNRLPVPDEDVQASLKEFAAHHKLSHRLLVSADRSLNEFYQVSGIPHAVIIDPTGKIRMIRVGSGSANAKAMSDLIEKLIKERAGT